MNGVTNFKAEEPKEEKTEDAEMQEETKVKEVPKMQPYDLSDTPPEPKTPLQTYHRCHWQKAKGNEYFKEKDYKKALAKWSRMELYAKAYLPNGDATIDALEKSKK